MCCFASAVGRPKGPVAGRGQDARCRLEGDSRTKERLKKDPQGARSERMLLASLLEGGSKTGNICLAQGLGAIPGSGNRSRAFGRLKEIDPV